MQNGGGWGALELAARYASIDLNDGDVTGGSQDTTLVRRELVHQQQRAAHVRLDAHPRNGRIGADRGSVPRINEEAEGLNIIQTRAQWTY